MAGAARQPHDIAGLERGVELGQAPRQDLARPAGTFGGGIGQVARNRCRKRARKLDDVLAPGPCPPLRALEAGLEVALQVVVAQARRRASLFCKAAELFARSLSEGLP